MLLSLAITVCQVRTVMKKVGKAVTKKPIAKETSVPRYLMLGWIYIFVSCQDSVEKVKVVKALPKAKVAKASLHALRLHVE